MRGAGKPSCQKPLGILAAYGLLCLYLNLSLAFKQSGRLNLNLALQLDLVLSHGLLLRLVLGLSDLDRLPLGLNLGLGLRK